MQRHSRIFDPWNLGASRDAFDGRIQKACSDRRRHVGSAWDTSVSILPYQIDLCCHVAAFLLRHFDHSAVFWSYSSPKRLVSTVEAGVPAIHLPLHSAQGSWAGLSVVSPRIPFLVRIRYRTHPTTSFPLPTGSFGPTRKTIADVSFSSSQPPPFRHDAFT